VGWFLSLAVAATIAGQPVSDNQVAHWSRAKGGEAQAFMFLVEGKWTEFEAQERGITVSDEDAREAADPPTDGLTQQDAMYASRLTLLTADIHAQIGEPAARSVTPDQVRAYVDTHAKFDPEKRTIRLVRTKTRRQAREVEREINHGLRWAQAARRYGGGGKTTVEPGRFDRRLERAVFKAKIDTTTRSGSTVFRVLKRIPARPMNRAQQEAQAWEILSSQAQQRAIDAFAGAFTIKWRPSTACAAKYQSQPVCAQPAMTRGPA